MKIGTIAQNQPFKPIPPSSFNEGARTTAEKITAIIATVLVSLGSFFLLPVDAALVLSLGTAALLAGICFGCEDGGLPRVQLPQTSPTLTQTSPSLVLQQPSALRPRVPPILRRPTAPQAPHVPVGHGHNNAPPPVVNAAAARGAGQQNPQPQPVVQRQNVAVNQQPAPHVPVGHGHNLPDAQQQPQPRLQLLRQVLNYVNSQQQPEPPQATHVPVGHGHNNTSPPVINPAAARGAGQQNPPPLVVNRATTGAPGQQNPQQQPVAQRQNVAVNQQQGARVPVGRRSLSE